jgi:hypothetical protein
VKCNSLFLLVSFVVLVAGCAPELPVETQALQSSNVGARLNKAGVQKVVRKRDKLGVVLVNGAEFEIRTCAWNEDVERLGGCSSGTSRTGREYVLTALPQLRYTGEKSGPGESKDYFLSRIDQDVRLVEEQAALQLEQQRQNAVAKSTWDEKK